MTKPSRPDFVLGTAGHIDHGKSALVKALTGTDPDRLLEEKNRGITIELGFAQLELPDGSTMGVVDVPGHERFVRQMIAGATGIDIALLCIAADDGIMPQTIEHLAVLELLAIPQCVVALTKVDLVEPEWIEFVTGEIQERLSATSYASAPIIPLSSRSGLGLEELKEALLVAVKQSRRTRQRDFARIPVDRVFTIKGSGTVITGTIWSGKVSLDDELEVFPSGMHPRVRFIQIHGEQVSEAFAGNRVALNLSSLKTSDIRPGDFLAQPNRIQASDKFDAWFTYIDTSKKGKPLKSGSRVHICHGTREVIGRILFMNGKEQLKNQERAFVQIRLEEPLPLTPHDRYIVRSYSPVAVIGGGTVLLSHPRHTTALSADETSLLEALLQQSDEAYSIALKLLNVPASAGELANYLGTSGEAAKLSLEKLLAKKQIISLGSTGAEDYYTSQQWLSKQLSRVESHLITHHNDNPASPGISLSELRQLFSRSMSNGAFEAFIERAQKSSELTFAEGMVSHSKAVGGAQKLQEQTAEKLFELLSAAGTKPPSLEDLIKQLKCDSSLAYRALGQLESKGLAVRINNALCFERKAFDSLKAAVVSHLEAHGEANAAELKDAMKTSRKYAIPLLEYFDAQNVLLRRGDVRVLKGH